MNTLQRDELVLLISRHLAAGSVTATHALPIFKDLFSEAPPSPWELMTQLAEIQSPAAELLRKELLSAQITAASRWYAGFGRDGSKSPAILPDLPAPLPSAWQEPTLPLDDWNRLLQIGDDLLFVCSREQELPEATAAMEQEFQKAMLRARAADFPCPQLLPEPLRREWEEALQLQCAAADHALDALSHALPQNLPAALNPEALLKRVCERLSSSAGNRPLQQQLLDLLLCAPDKRFVHALADLALPNWAKERAMVALAMRFGTPLQTWEEWTNFLLASRAKTSAPERELERLFLSREPDLSLIWARLDGDANSWSAAELKAMATARPRSVNPELFRMRWQNFLKDEDLKTLFPPAQPPKLPAAVGGHCEAAGGDPRLIPGGLRDVPGVDPRLVSGGLTEAAYSEPPAPTLWEQHIQPFLAENWHLAAGLLMVVMGASLLAYFTWDKHWLIRYTIMPALLALLTCCLAGVGKWLEKKETNLKGTGALLRGAAICLLPVNFMAVALLSRDPEVSWRAVVIPIMAAIYIGFFGWALRRWCEEVHAGLGKLQARMLLVLNALVTLGPIASLLAGNHELATRSILAAGFYLGFFGMAASIHGFAKNILTAELVRERRVQWFFIGTMAATFLQVFALVHWAMRFQPHPTTYACLAIFAGCLVLMVERRLLELGKAPQPHGEESFVGFALVLLGLVMGWTSPGLRIGCFLLAGIVWLYQASFRKDFLHYWIGLTLVMLAGGAIGLLDQFPKSHEFNLLPFLGLAVTAGFGGIRVGARKWKWMELSQAAAEFQPAILVLSVAVATLSQWHYHSAPWAAGFAILITAAVFGWRAHRLQRLSWVHSTMALCALALPYLGCVDMEGLTLRGNSLVFGLAALSGLWLGAIALRPSPLMLKARSTVLWSYGSLALAAMVLRVLIEQGRQLPPWQAWLDFAGPIGMAAVLVLAAYYSRSLVPSAMAAVMLAILFPEMQAQFKLLFPWVAWGSGLGSSLSALAMGLLIFALQRWPKLANLPQGDLFLGETPFPFQRFDSTLFTWPLLAASLFLAVRVDGLGLLRFWNQGGHLPVNAAIALGITAATWTLLAVHFRAHPAAKIMVHLGWIAFLCALEFTGRFRGANAQIPFLLTGIVLQALVLAYRRTGLGWIEELLCGPLEAVLRNGSLVFSWLLVIGLALDWDWDQIQWLSAFVAAQLVWHGFKRNQNRFGLSLFWLCLLVLLSAWAPGRGFLALRLSVESALLPVLLVAIGTQVAQLLLEFQPSAYERLKGFFVPFQGSTLALVFLSTAFVAAGILLSPMVPATNFQPVLLIAALGLSARANRSGAIALATLLMGVLCLYQTPLQKLPFFELRLAFLATPWRLSCIAFAMVLLGYAGKWLHQRFPKIVSGAYPLGRPGFAPVLWLHLPATGLALAAALFHATSPEFRMQTHQLVAPYLGALTLALVALSFAPAWIGLLSGILLGLGNIEMVNLVAGKLLHQQGGSDFHILCLGLTLTLLAGSAIRIVTTNPVLRQRIALASTLLAGAILLLLGFNYFSKPNLEAISQFRFALSGALAFAAARYLRSAARNPLPGQIPEWLEGFYHVGIALSIWCFALMIPAFRYPGTVLVALALPGLYFYLRAEIGLLSASESLRFLAQSYRNSSATMAFLLLGLYVFRAAFQMVLLPDQPINTDHYHTNAFLVIAVGLLMFRLTGLGATSWLGFYGGLAVMGGTYFAVTLWPGLSPFEHAAPAAWAAIAVAHFFTTASFQKSPLRSLIQEMGRIEEPTWHSLRRSWGRCLLAGSQGLILIAIVSPQTSSYQIAPLLAGAASIFIYQGILGRWALYLAIGVGQIVLALHAGFMVPSYLPAKDVIWVILGLWAVADLAHPFARRWVSAAYLAPIAGGLFVLGMAHVGYHTPWSLTGLWAVAIMAALGALTPQATRTPENIDQKLGSILLPAALPWLVYFSQVRSAGATGSAFVEPLSILLTLIALLGIGFFARFWQQKGAPRFPQIGEPHAYLFHHSLAQFALHGERVFQLLFGIGFLGTALVQAFHYGTAFDETTLALLSLLWTGFGVTLFKEAKASTSSLPYYLAQLAVLAFFALWRRQLMLTTSFWRYEYDVWVSLAVSCALAGAKGLIDREPKQKRLALMLPLFVLPAIALVWTLVHHLGTDLALVVVGLQSLIYAFLGKDNRESPYNVVAILGFVAFVSMAFWTKLELRAWNAYAIPVGTGVLALLQLFGKGMAPDTKNRIRFLALFAMMGSSAYYALASDRYPIGFNLTLLLLCLVVMAAGSFFRARLYVMFGFGGLVLAIGSIAVKAVMHMDQTGRMVSIGSLILVLGIGLVSASIAHKTHREKVEEVLQRWREKLGAWE